MISFEIVVVIAGCVLLVGVLIGFLFIHRRHRALRSQIDALIEASAQVRNEQGSRMDKADTELARLQGQVRELEEQVRLASGAPAKSWTNISRRVQAVRMLRGGASCERIAAELSMTVGEVDLIRNVQHLTESSEAVAESPTFRSSSISAMRG